MEIAHIETIPVEIKLRQAEEPGGLAPYIGNAEQISSTRRLIIKVQTTDGTVGWSEFWPDAAYSLSASRAIIEDDIGTKLKGASIWDNKTILDLFEREYLTARPFIGAVEIAIWDARGKELGASVSELLGGKIREKVPFAYLFGITKPQEAREHVEYAKNEGFDVIKVKGGRNWRDDIERLISMDEMNADVQFRLDPNQGWSVTQAVNFGNRLRRCGIDLQYLEQPIKINSPSGIASLHNQLHVPLAINEDTYRPGNVSALAEDIDAAVLDIVPCGGIAATQRLAARATAHGVSLAHHNGFDLGIKTAAILHTVATTPGFTLEADTIYYALSEHIIKHPFEFADGHLTVPDGPGLGVEVDEECLEENRMKI